MLPLIYLHALRSDMSQMLACSGAARCYTKCEGGLSLFLRLSVFAVHDCFAFIRVQAQTKKAPLVGETVTWREEMRL